ncbi:putative antitoxin, contains HTH domain [Candidatus Methanophagaceae archaeon]|nr:putative antitoxin, contains HTH domain [Methanophagales archaeon]
MWIKAWVIFENFVLRKEMKIAAAAELYKREEVSISKAAELAGLKTEYGLSIANSECIAVAKMRERVLLSDDKYLGKMAINEGVEHIYDLLTFLEA